MRILAFVIVAGCARPAARTVSPEPPPARDVRVQLDVPPNAPGERDDLDVGREPAVLRDPRLAFDSGGAVLVSLTLEAESPEPRRYRLDGDSWTATEAEPVLREDAPAGTARTVSGRHARVRVIATGQTLSVETERRPRSDRWQLAGPPLIPRGSCVPVALALAADPIRVAWMDCPIGAPRLTVSALSSDAWAHAQPPAELVPAGAQVDAAFREDRLLVVTQPPTTESSWPEGRGSLVSFADGTWQTLAALPLERIARPGPPALAADGGEVLAAWHEPRRSGVQILLRSTRRARWPLVGRGGVDTSIARGDGARPAIAWLDGKPVLVVSNRAGLQVLRWERDDWRRWGATIPVDSPPDEAAIAVRTGGPIVAWRSGSSITLVEHGEDGWMGRTSLDAREPSAGLVLAVGGEVAAIAWIESGALGRVHRSVRPGRWEWAADVAGGGGLDVQVFRGAVVVAYADQARVRVEWVGMSSASSPEGPEATAPPALAVAPDGPVMVWPSTGGPAVARFREGAWAQVDCPAAEALGPSVDAVDLAAAPDGSVWLAARRRGTSSHVRVARCTVP